MPMPESAARRLWVAHWAYPLTALGPGRRLGLWVAGCTLGCAGCITPQLWPRTAGRSLDVARLAAYLADLSAPLDGLTLSGGEPFEQPTALAALCARLRELRPEWNVLAFSGYSLARLQCRADTATLLAQCDLLIAGAYVAHKPGATTTLRASANQTAHALTPVGGVLQARLGEGAPRANLGSDGGTTWLFGILNQEERQAMHEQLRSDPHQATQANV